jgi:curved DNA binding protein
VVVGAKPDAKATGPKADAILACYNALEAVIRMLRPGQHKSNEMTDMIGKIADTFHVKPVENMLSFQLKQHQIGNEDEEDAKHIIQNPSDEQRNKMKKFEIGTHEVWAIDILMSTGDGKSKEGTTRTTVYRHKPNAVYQLKMKASREFYYEAKKRSGEMAFSLRWWDEEKKARMGVVECERHELLKPYKVYYEKEGEFVTQFKATVLVMPGSLVKITGLPLDASLYQSEHSITDKTVKQLLESSLKSQAKKQKKKAAAKKEGETDPPKKVENGEPTAPVKA